MKNILSCVLCFLGHLSMYWSVDSPCPSDVSVYQEAIANLSCTGNLFGHCLLDEAKNKILTCLGRSWIQPGFCPVYNSEAKKIDVFLCKETLGKCPDSTFWSNELYKYPSCLREVSYIVKSSTPKAAITTTVSLYTAKGAVTFKSFTSKDNQTTGTRKTEPESSSNTKPNESVKMIVIIAVIIAVLVIFVVVVVVVLVRKCRNKRGKEEEITGQDEKVALDQKGAERTFDEPDASTHLTSLENKETALTSETSTPTYSNISESKDEKRSAVVTTDRFSTDINSERAPTKHTCTIQDDEIKRVLDTNNTVLLIAEEKDDLENLCDRICKIKQCEVVKDIIIWNSEYHTEEKWIMLKCFINMGKFNYDYYMDRLNIFENLRVVIPISREEWQENRNDMRIIRLFRNAYEWNIVK